MIDKVVTQASLAFGAKVTNWIYAEKKSTQETTGQDYGFNLQNNKTQRTCSR